MMTATTPPLVKQPTEPELLSLISFPSKPMVAFYEPLDSRTAIV